MKYASLGSAGADLQRPYPPGRPITTHFNIILTCESLQVPVICVVLHYSLCIHTSERPTAVGTFCMLPGLASLLYD